MSPFGTPDTNPAGARTPLLPPAPPTTGQVGAAGRGAEYAMQGGGG